MAFGIEGLAAKLILEDTSSTGPALASHDGRLFIAWKGSGNDNLNVMFSEDDGASFRGKHISDETSDSSPALVSHDGSLFIAWKGSGNDNLNVARVGLFSNTAGGSGIEGLIDKRSLDDTSSTGPKLASNGGRLFITWKGSGNDNLNVMFSEDDGASFRGKHISDETSDSSPALVSDELFIAWKGSGNDNLNVARVEFSFGGSGFTIGGLAAKLILEDTSSTGPALASHDGRLFIAWKGSGNDNLNVMFSEDDGASFRGKHISDETSDSSPALVSHDGSLFIAWKGSGNDNLNVARVGLFSN